MITKEELEAIKTRVAKEVETPIPANWESHIDVILDEDIPKLISTVEELQEQNKKLHAENANLRHDVLKCCTPSILEDVK